MRSVNPKDTTHLIRVVEGRHLDTLAFVAAQVRVLGRVYRGGRVAFDQAHRRAALARQLGQPERQPGS